MTGLGTALGACVKLTAMGPSTLGATARYTVAVALIGFGTLLRLAIAPQEAGLPYVTYFPAATLAAVIGGMGPALLATVLGAVTATTLFIPPFGEFKLVSEAVVSAIVFILDEVVVCSAIEAMRFYYRGHVEAREALERANEVERQARLRAEQAEGAKSRFLAAASHDLRQPYQAVRLFHNVLQTGPLPPERYAEVLAKMDEAMTAGEALLQALLHVSTLDAGVVVPDPVEVDVGELMASIDTRHRPVALAKGLCFRSHACSGVVRTDPVLLGRILDNLTANAIRYTETGGVMVACRRRGNRAMIEIYDTGIGIAREHQESIFEEFFQVGNQERDRTKGVGLGLSVVRKTAQLLGAEISVQSQEGRGTRFRVTLPSRLKPARQPLPA